MPQPTNQRTRQGEASRARRQQPNRNADDPISDPTEQNLVNSDSSASAVADLKEEHREGQEQQKNEQLSPLAREIINVLPDIKPLIVDRLMDKLMPKIMAKLENGNFLKYAEKSEELAEKMESVVTRVENIRRADNLRNMIEIDKLRQVQKEKTVRIIGLSENKEVSDYMVEMSKKMNVELDKNDMEGFRIGKQKQTIPGAESPKPRAALLTFRTNQKKSDFLRNKRKIRDELKKDRILIFEDLTKARRTLLSVVKEKYRNAHSRNGDAFFFNNNKELVRISKPDDLFRHGFTEADILKCETALAESA